MTTLCDVVNFNCDASCLDSATWLNAMSGGRQSQLHRWLDLYVELEKPIALGFTGASLADINAFNPEALTLLREKPQIFQILWRPFAHDLPFFRTDAGFTLNLSLGRLVAETLLGRVSPIYLPPEFMQTNRQTALLAQMGALATMIMPSRFSVDVAKRLPAAPFLLRGIPACSLACIPLNGELTKSYLSCIQLFDSEVWQRSVSAYDNVTLWRDGESSFLIPDGLERERFWLESAVEERHHLQLPDSDQLGHEHCYTYPVHPFSAWMNELSMIWFMPRVRDLEQKIAAPPSSRYVARWLNCISSDILSSVEKVSPIIPLQQLNDPQVTRYKIARSNRGFEGEALLEAAEKEYSPNGESAWEKKAFAREKLVSKLL